MRKRYVWILGASLAVISLFGAGCSDNENNGEGDGNSGDGDAAAFDPDRADELAHAMVLAPEDLPGRGWEIVAEDQFDDDDGDDDFERLAEDIPECQGLSDLARLGEVLGESEDEDLPAGRAKVELERPGQQLLPANVEMEVEIEESVSDIQGGWQIAKDLFESDSVQECFPKLMQAAAFEGAGEAEGIEFEIETRDAAAEAPNDGISMAFLMKVNANDLFEVNMAVDMYMWPQSNAGITLLILRDVESMEDKGVQAIVDAADEKVRAAAE